MLKCSLVITFLILLVNIYAQAVQWESAGTDIHEIQIRARAAKIIVQRSSTNSIKVSVTGSNESLWREDVQSNILKVSGPEDSGHIEDSNLVLEIPAGVIQSKLVFEEVRAEINSVSHLILNSLRGKIIAHSTGEGIKYFMQKGEIQSFQHQGNLEIESFGGKISVFEGQSNLKIRLFSGELIIDKNSGALSLESQSSTAKINSQQGVVSLQWGRGNLVMTDFMGRLEGKSNDGQLQFKVKPESMIDLEALRGKVMVSLPVGSGASLNLRSANGELNVPAPLKPAREGRFRVARGTLSGALKGSIHIRSEDASIGIR